MTILTWILIIITVTAIILGILGECAYGDSLSGVLIGLATSGILCWGICFVLSLNYWEINTDEPKYSKEDVKAISTYTGVKEKEVNSIIQKNGDIEITLKSVMPKATDKDVKIVKKYAENATRINNEVKE